MKSRSNPAASRRRGSSRIAEINVSPQFHARLIAEPELVFGNGRTFVDPKFGITNYGPNLTHKNKIQVGVVGTAQGIDLFERYLQTARQPILPGLNSRNEFYNATMFPDFPGIGAGLTFRTDFVTNRTLQREIPSKIIEVALRTGGTSKKLEQIVKLWMEKLQTLKDVDPEPDIVVVVFPKEVEDAIGTVGREFQKQRLPLTPGRKFEKRLRRELDKTGQEFLPLAYDDSPEATSKGYWNLHHAIKAKAMGVGIPTQMAWESFLKGEGLTQDPASVAWNFFTALFYKAGHIPWQPADIPQGTCFVGVSFFKETPYANSDTRTALAQVFSGTGEGLVLKGERAIIDKARDAKAHLDFQSSQQLLAQAIKLYEQHHQTKPTRVVVHKTSRYWPEEFEGFKKAVGDVYAYDFLTLEKSDFRFMRTGKESVLRGTMIQLEPRRYLLFTVGYVPYFGMYPGQRVPVPLEILEHHGDSSAERVCSEIMTLTKLNWNSCSFCSSDPITTLFSKTVGKIMTELPAGSAPQTKYRFYM